MKTASDALHLEDFICQMQALKKPNTRSAKKHGWCDLRKIRADLAGPGDYASLDFGGIHMMENDPNSGEDLVTLHFYAEPLREIHVFKPEDHRVDLARLRYSLEDRI